jgi:hypothetical protein
VMGGLARRYGSEYRDEEGAIGSGPDCYADLMSHWLNVSAATGMPLDPRLWTQNPIARLLSFPRSLTGPMTPFCDRVRYRRIEFLPSTALPIRFASG